MKERFKPERKLKPVEGPVRRLEVDGYDYDTVYDGEIKVTETKSGTEGGVDPRTIVDNMHIPKRESVHTVDRDINEFAVSAPEDRLKLRNTILEVIKGSKTLKAAGLAAFVATAATIKDKGQDIDDVYERLDLPDVNSETMKYGQQSVPEIPEVLEAKVENETIDEMVKASDISQFESEVLKQQQALKLEDIEMTLELALEPAEGTDGLGRMEYIQKAYTFDDDKEAEERGWSEVPSEVWNELKMIVPGWVGQESRFDESRVSDSGGEGPWQYIDIGWKDVRGEVKKSVRFDDQAEASKDSVINNYNYIHNIVGEENIKKLKSQFDSEEEYSRDLMANLVLLAHNPGPTSVGEKLKKYIQTMSFDDIPKGKDLFWHFVNTSGFSKEAREYVGKVRAWAEALHQEHSKREV